MNELLLCTQRDHLFHWLLFCVRVLFPLKRLLCRAPQSGERTPSAQDPKGIKDLWCELGWIPPPPASLSSSWTSPSSPGRAAKHKKNTHRLEIWNFKNVTGCFRCHRSTLVVNSAFKLHSYNSFFRKLSWPHVDLHKSICQFCAEMWTDLNILNFGGKKVYKYATDYITEASRVIMELLVARYPKDPNTLVPQ